uniref:PAZ domain-containing protein n=1 Tax=Pristionchus pacificus TaxID=54126 RepID=A0A8R1Z6V8_PRIPA
MSLFPLQFHALSDLISAVTVLLCRRSSIMAERTGGSGQPMPTEDEQTAAIERMKLPDRIGEPGSNGAAFGIPTTVTLNVFRLHLEKVPGKIFKFDLQFIACGKNGKDFEINNALHKSPEYLRSKKRHALVAFLRAAHESEKEYFRQQQIGDPDVNYWRHCCAFDCGNAYFTAVELPNHSGAIPEELWKASDYTQCYIPNCEGPIKWELKKAEEFRIDGEFAKSPQAQAFFTILATQNLSRSDEIDVKKDAAYSLEGETTSEHKELRKGILAASRMVGSDASIQLHSKIGMFFKPQPLLEYLRESSGKHSTMELVAFLRNPRASERLRREIFNLPLQMRHIKSQRIFECKGLAATSAIETTFPYNDRVVSIAEYFLERYQYRLQHPTLPLILERNKRGQSFHPIECLDITAERVSNQKMTPKGQEEMISKSCRAPAVLARDLETSRNIAQLDTTNKYLNAFEVKIKDGFSELPAKLLAKPHVIGMAGIKPEITDIGKIGYSKGSSFKFAGPVKLEKPIVLFIVDNAIDIASP